MSIDQPGNNDKKEISANDIRFDDAAFEKLFKTYFVPLCAYCQYKFEFDLDGAKEVVHTAFIKLWENREHLSPQMPVKTYLNKIITNKSLDILKHQKVKQKHQVHILNTTAEFSTNEFEKVDSRELGKDIETAISELPDQMRKIFELSRFDGLKYAEIAHQLNISIKTVETQMGRALAKLRKKLGHYLLLILTVLNNFF